MEPDKMVNEIVERSAEKVEGKFADKIEAISAQVRELAAGLVKKPEVEVIGPKSELRAVSDQMAAIGRDMMQNGQKRSLTLSGSGAYNVLSSFEKAVHDKHDIVSKARWIYGAGAQTNIPIFSARPARPVKQAEGATGIAGDATAAQSVTTITPYAYYSEIFVSAENLVQGAASVEAALPELFGEAFANALHYGMITGDATMTGVFADAALTNDITCAAAGHPTWTDLVGFAGTLKAKAFNPVIIMSSAFVGDLLLSTAASHEGLKMELLTKGSIRGVPVWEDPFAPTTHAAGDIVAVGMDMSNYVIACAREFTIEPIRAAGTAGVYFQATGFYNGKPIIAANGWQLEAV